VVTRIIIIILSIIIIVGWKPILYWLFGPKNQTLSGISLAKRSRSGPNSLYLDRSRGDNVQGILGAIGPFWPKWGLGRVPQSRSFFCLVNHTLFRQLCNGRFSPNVVTKRSSVSRCRIRKDLFEKFYFMGHLPPKSEIELGSNRHLTQSRLQVTGCTAERCCLLHVVVQGPGSFRGLVNFFVWCMVATYRTTYGCEAMGRQSCQIFGFWPIFPIQIP